MAFALGWLCRPGATAPAAAANAPARETHGAPKAASARHASPAASPLTRAESELATPGAVLRALNRARDRPTRLREFAARLRDAEPSDYPALLAALRTTRSPETAELQAMLCSAWAEHDGAAAFTASRALAERDGEYPALHAALRAWAQRDPTAARMALEHAHLTDLAGDEMAAWAEGWAGGDFRAAEQYLAAAAHGSGASDDAAELPAAVVRGMQAVARARIAAEPAAVLDWYAGLREPLRERLRETLLSQLAADAPQVASRWLAQDASAQLGSSQLTPLLRSLPLAGFDEQFAWARTPANAVTRDSALVAVVRDAAPADLVSLGEWLAARADDASLSPAFSAYAIQVVRKSPDAAVTWALSLDQPELRQRALDAVATEWMSVSPRAAREWAQRTRLVDWETIVR